MATSFIIKAAVPECTIQNSRTFPFNISKMWQAFANADLLKEWWGPKGFTNSFREFDFSVGGYWRFFMHGPQVGKYPNECRFLKIEEPYFIAWDHFSPPKFEVQVGLEEVDAGHTLLDFKQIFDSEAERDKIAKFASEKNEENFDKLHDLLKKISI